MLAHEEAVLTRRELVWAGWGTDAADRLREVDRHISKLRVKLGDSAHEHRLLRTHYDQGYSLHVPRIE